MPAERASIPPSESGKDEVAERTVIVSGEQFGAHVRSASKMRKKVRQNGITRTRRPPSSQIRRGKVVGRGDTALVFALTRGDAPSKAKSATHEIHSR
jgi:hypothetical protein